MIHLNKNSSASAQKICLENLLQQSFAIFRYICATFEGRG